jgi:hypothetical protein
MTTRQLGFKSLAGLAISVGDTTPNPGSPGVVAWSTTTLSLMAWTGSSWVTVLSVDGQATILLPPAGTVSPPGLFYAKLYGRPLAGQSTLEYMTPNGMRHSLQDRISEQGSSFYLPNGGSTAGLNLGTAWTVGGTISHPTPSATAPAIISQQKRTRFANVITNTNQTLGIHTATAEKRYWRGNAVGLGGFLFHARFSIGLFAAPTVRLFVGLSDQNTSPVAADALVGNACGFWHDTTDAASVLSFVTRDGTTTTKTAITLASPLAAGQGYECWIATDSNGTTIGYKLVELNTGTTLADTTTSTTIPLNTAFMGATAQMSNGTANITATTVALDLSALSVQSDN